MPEDIPWNNSSLREILPEERGELVPSLLKYINFIQEGFTTEMPKAEEIMAYITNSNKLQISGTKALKQLLAATSMFLNNFKMNVFVLPIREYSADPKNPQHKGFLFPSIPLELSGKDGKNSRMWKIEVGQITFERVKNTGKGRETDVSKIVPKITPGAGRAGSFSLMKLPKLNTVEISSVLGVSSNTQRRDVMQPESTLSVIDQAVKDMRNMAGRIQTVSRSAFPSRR